MADKTNQEWIIENNLKIEEIKQLANTLPDYQDIEPIYGTDNYELLSIPWVTSSDYIQFFNICYPYILVTRRGPSESWGQMQIGKIENSEIIPISNLVQDAYQYWTLIGYDNDFIYGIQTGTQSGSYKVKKFSLTEPSYGTETNYSLSTIDTYETYTQIKNNLVMKVGRYKYSTTYPTTFYLFNPATGFTQYKLSSYPSISQNFNDDVFLFSDYKLYKFIIDNGTLNIVISPTATFNDTKGINYYSNKLFKQDGIYGLTNSLTITEKIADINITLSGVLWCLSENIYIDKGNNKVYEFDEETNTFTYKSTLTVNIYSSRGNLGVISDYKLFNCEVDVTKEIGFRYDGIAYYYGKYSTLNNEKILNGYEVQDKGINLVGTMPNNGQLNYTPTSSVQTIPAGYTSGGTIEAVNYEEQGALSPEDTATVEEQISDLFGEEE